MSTGWEAFFRLPEASVAALFDGTEHAWEAVARLPAWVEDQVRPGRHGDIEDGAWVEEGVEVRPGARVQRGAIVRAPSILCEGSEVRSGAVVRGHVYLGRGSKIGVGAEVRQALLLDRISISHQNCVFTSLLGNDVWIGGHSSTANVLLNKREVEIRRRLPDGSLRRHPTGTTHFGAVIGDGSSVAGMTVLNPGTVIGRGCTVFQCGGGVSGWIPDGHIVRPTHPPFEVVPDPKARNP